MLPIPRNSVSLFLTKLRGVMFHVCSICLCSICQKQNEELLSTSDADLQGSESNSNRLEPVLALCKFLLTYVLHEISFSNILVKLMVNLFFSLQIMTFHLEI
jgi:hypothetical protein